MGGRPLRGAVEGRARRAGAAPLAVLLTGQDGALELQAFAAAGGSAVRLGPTVLRTSTAGAAAVAVLSARTGRWS